MNFVKPLLTAFAAISLGTSAWAFPVLVTSQAAQNANDSLDWNTAFGPQSNIPVPNGSSATSLRGVGVTIADAVPNTLLREDQGAGWAGALPNGDHLLWNQNSGPDTITFNTAVYGAGFLLQNGAQGLATYQIQAFGPGNTLLATFSADTNAQGVLYIGVQDTSASITSFVVMGTAGANANNFAIDTLQINAAPELNANSAVLPLAFAFFAGALMVSRRRNPGLAQGDC